MSIAALNWAFDLPLRGAEKSVLLALAWRANQDAKAWPSQGGLSQAAGVSCRHVRTALAALEQRGLITVERQNGRLSAYVLQMQTPEVSSGVPDPTPEVSSGVTPEPRKSVPGTPELSSYEQTIKTQERKKESVRRGSRLPTNWTPTAEDLDFAKTLGLDGQQVAAAFRDYWIAKPGAMAVKLDWPATWRNWCRKDADRRPAAKRPTFKNGFLELIAREQEAGAGQTEPSSNFWDELPNNPFIRRVN